MTRFIMALRFHNRKPSRPAAGPASAPAGSNDVLLFDSILLSQLRPRLLTLEAEAR